MKKYVEKEKYKLYQGSMLDMLEVIDKESVDCIITDPPYELNFMNKGWDNAGVSFNADTWKKCYEVLKEGGYLLAFGGSRTFHRIACAIEDAGFEIRDTIMWLYGSGFPKSMNIGLAIDKVNGVESEVVGTGRSGVSSHAYQSEETTTAGEYEIKRAKNQWNGWGTCLKPAYEPIIIARKPFKGSLVDNVIKNGIGGLNIDECRVETTDEIKSGTMPDFRDIGKKSKESIGIDKLSFGQIDGEIARKEYTPSVNGRFPANTILTYDETDFDEVCGGFPYTKTGNIKPHKNKSNGICNFNTQNETINYFNGDNGSASRYFYCAKASKKDRDEGLDNFDKEKVNDGRNTPIDNAFQRGETLRKNTHPTVKLTELMQYLVRLVAPKGAIILDPFNGSGSTGKAVMYENKERKANYKYIGIELTEEYLPIAQARIEYVMNLKQEREEKFEQLEF